MHRKRFFASCILEIMTNLSLNLPTSCELFCLGFSKSSGGLGNPPFSSQDITTDSRALEVVLTCKFVLPGYKSRYTAQGRRYPGYAALSFYMHCFLDLSNIRDILASLVPSSGKISWSKTCSSYFSLQSIS